MQIVRGQVHVEKKYCKLKSILHPSILQVKRRIRREGFLFFETHKVLMVCNPYIKLLCKLLKICLSFDLYTLNNNKGNHLFISTNCYAELRFIFFWYFIVQYIYLIHMIIILCCSVLSQHAFLNLEVVVYFNVIYRCCAHVLVGSDKGKLCMFISTEKL